MADFKVYVVPDKDAGFGEKVRCWVKNRKTDVEHLWREHKEEILTLTPVAVGGIVAIAKWRGQRAKAAAELMKDRRIYDPRMGHYYFLSRTPSDVQWAEIDRRFRDGEDYGRILKSMSLLKK